MAKRKKPAAVQGRFRCRFPAAIRISLRMRKIKWRLPEHWQDDAIEKQF
jgi:hypothetical protein